MNDARARPGPGPDQASVGVFGMRLFLVSLAMVFGASIVAYLVIRHRAPAWPPPEIHLSTRGLWASAGIVIGISLLVGHALASVRAGRSAETVRSLAGALGLAVAFLAVQTGNGWALYRGGFGRGPQLFAFTFYMLTGLHAAHVIGGIVPLAVVLTRAARKRYGPDYHAGVVYCAMYWHFLDAVWLLLAALLIHAAS